jgi:hypothetical protein
MTHSYGRPLSKPEVENADELKDDPQPQLVRTIVGIIVLAIVIVVIVYLMLPPIQAA